VHQGISRELLTSAEYELLATLDGPVLQTRRFELPPLEAGQRRSEHFNGYALSCTNEKGESPRGPAGPAPIDGPIGTAAARRHTTVWRSTTSPVHAIPRPYEGMLGKALRSCLRSAV